jgi:UDP-3-O-[3-hydroxymyristoyl] N-acetylglucosamine deacetylase
MQRTISNVAQFVGTGLHAGDSVQAKVHPGEPDTGIRFLRNGYIVPANFSLVEHSPLCTLLCDPNGNHVSTVEHFMAAVWALGLDNLIVELSSDEMPILDGSSLPFIRGLTKAGIVNQCHPKRRAKVLRRVDVHYGESSASLSPASNFSAGIEIDFKCAAIGHQELEFDGSFEGYMADIAMARTFCMSEDIAAMHSCGRALGGSLENAVVFEGDRIVNTHGLRIEQEPVRHKMLDAIGDLALLGRPILGRYEAIRPGHRLTNMLLREACRLGAIVDEHSGEPIRALEETAVLAA